jgi:hypothetical protein
MADLCRDFWIHEARMGQQVAQLNNRYMMMMMMKFIIDNMHSVEEVKICNL